VDPDLAFLTNREREREKARALESLSSGFEMRFLALEPV
jgi:hypothetical protein